MAFPSFFFFPFFCFFFRYSPHRHSDPPSATTLVLLSSFHPFLLSFFCTQYRSFSEKLDSLLFGKTPTSLIRRPRSLLILSLLFSGSRKAPGSISPFRRYSPPNMRNLGLEPFFYAYLGPYFHESSIPFLAICWRFFFWRCLRPRFVLPRYPPEWLEHVPDDGLLLFTLICHYFFFSKSPLVFQKFPSRLRSPFQFSFSYFLFNLLEDTRRLFLKRAFFLDGVFSPLCPLDSFAHDDNASTPLLLILFLTAFPSSENVPLLPGLSFAFYSVLCLLETCDFLAFR